MIFNSKYLNITDKQIINDSFHFIYNELFNTSSDFNIRLLTLFQHIFKMDEETFINNLRKYGNTVYHGLYKKIYTQVIESGKSTTSLYFFKEYFKKYIGDDINSFKTFMSCFYIEESYIEELSKEVEKSIENLKDELTFSQYEDAYKTELKYLLENYAIKKEA